MSTRSVYLAKSRASSNQRHHFAVFIPNAASDRSGIDQDFQSTSCQGTIIHVVGEPVLSGYVLEIKRNYECMDERDLRQLVPLGRVSTDSIYDPPSGKVAKETITRAPLEREAMSVRPPPRGQNIRANIDGVTARRCQEWTMSYLERLVEKGFVEPQAVSKAQAERDPPNFGIFGAPRPEKK